MFCIVVYSDVIRKIIVLKFALPKLKIKIKQEENTGATTYKTCDMLVSAVVFFLQNEYRVYHS